MYIFQCYCLYSSHPFLPRWYPKVCSKWSLFEYSRKCTESSHVLLESSTSLLPFLFLFNISSVQLSHSVVSDSLRPHDSHHARPPCPSPTPGVHSDSCPSSQWCHPSISFSVVPFSSCPQYIPASGSFLMSQLFTWGGQSTGASALASFLPKNTQDWSLEWTGPPNRKSTVEWHSLLLDL